MTDPKHTEPVDLLPCPFCGGEAELHENTSGQAQGFVPVFNPGCKACDVRSPDWYGTEAEAIAAWNTRTAAEAASRARLTAALEMVEDYHAAHIEQRTRAQKAEAEVERLREALTPSGDTKAAYMGEFSFNLHRIDEFGDEYPEKVYVPWTTIKEIMAAIAARAALSPAAKGGDHG